MEITMPQMNDADGDKPSDMPIEFSGSLTAEEAAEFARGAHRRLATVLGTDEAAALEKARFMLTDMEMGVFLEETVKARAADHAIRELGLTFLLEPSIRSTQPYREGEPYAFEASVHPVPPMELDLETPIELTEELCTEVATCTPEDEIGQDSPKDEKDADKASKADGPDATAASPSLPSIAPKFEKHILRVLRARLTGTVSATLESAAFARENKAFHAALEEDDETYREYRIRTGKKPQEVEADLRHGAMRQLYDEIALETIFREQSLEVAPEDEAAILHEMAPDREEALRQELDNAGKLWMLAQKARRAKALTWAIDNLVR